jgi:hypothetical protein
MTICHFLSAAFCLRRAVWARRSSGRQTPPVRGSSECPAEGHNPLIAKVFAALRPARLRFFPCFSGENKGDTSALAPLFAVSARITSSTRRMKLACVSSAGKRDRRAAVACVGGRLRADRVARETRKLDNVSCRLSLPARSLRGRPASLRTVPDGAGRLLRKRLIWRVLLMMRPPIEGVELIFLPALRERGQGGPRAFPTGPAAPALRPAR